MEDNYNYEGFDLRICSMYDLASVLDDCPPFLISPEKDLSEDQLRILSLYTYADEYDLTDLKKKLDQIYKEELASIF